MAWARTLWVPSRCDKCHYHILSLVPVSFHHAGDGSPDHQDILYFVQHCKHQDWSEAQRENVRLTLNPANKRIKDEWVRQTYYRNVFWAQHSLPSIHTVLTPFSTWTWVSCLSPWNRGLCKLSVTVCPSWCQLADITHSTTTFLSSFTN